MREFCLAVLITVALMTAGRETSAGRQPVGRWGMFELAVPNSRAYKNPFADVTLEGKFLSPSKKQFKVLGFYDGGETWRLRFMPDEIGDWSYTARFSDGSADVKGTFKCVKSKLHGPLRVNRENPLWFEYADGKPFYLRAFYLRYIGALDDDTLAKTLDFLKAQGYNTIVGPGNLPSPPNRRPWEQDAQGNFDFSRPNLYLWKSFDRALQMTAERGMVFIPFHIFGGTNRMPKIPTWEDRDLFLRCWVARWDGYWNATFQPISEWEEGWSDSEILLIGSRIHELDGGRHLVSMHSLKASTEKVQKADWFSYCTVQDKLTDWNPMKYTWLVGLYRKVQKPILAHECLWEGCVYQKDAGMDMDNMRRGAWVIALCGGQINYADRVVPPSRYHLQSDEGNTFSELGMAMKPHGLFYEQLKVLGDFMQSIHFWRMTPQPELSGTGVCLADAGREYVAYSAAGDKMTLDLSGAKGSFTGRWLNPRDGKFGEPFKIEGGEKREFQTPDSNDWILHLRKI